MNESGDNSNSEAEKKNIRFSLEERKLVVEMKIRGAHWMDVTNEFRTKFNKTISKAGVFKIMARWTNHSMLHDFPKQRNKTVRTPENIEAVNQCLKRERDLEPGMLRSSCRRNDFTFSAASFNRICKQDLKLHPYKLVKRQALGPTDCTRRLSMCRFLQEQPVKFYNYLAVSDEAWFCLNGHVYNPQNSRCYSEAKMGVPEHWFSEASQSQKKVMVFIVMVGIGMILEPYFYDDEANNRLTAERYLMTLKETIIPELRRRLNEEAFNQLWWMQDGAAPHTAGITMKYLDKIFNDKLLSLKAIRGEEWSPRSPDLNPCDYWAWGYIKNRVYHTLPRTIVELKEKIIAACSQIPNDMIQTVMLSMQKRAHQVVLRGGKHIERLKDL